jgi:hypothetical protein
MAEKLRIFVSATADLEHARAAIGRAIAELPVQIGVEIRRTPHTGASYDDIFEWIANVDRVYFLMGRDITAPAGAEWHLAWKLERSVLHLRSVSRRGEDRRTPAAQEFMRNAFIEWVSFRSTTELARIVTLDLIRLLNHPNNRYGLTVTEIELLNAYAKGIDKMNVDAGPEDRKGEGGGAEGGAVLLDVTHRENEEDLIVG